MEICEIGQATRRSAKFNLANKKCFVKNSSTFSTKDYEVAVTSRTSVKVALFTTFTKDVLQGLFSFQGENVIFAINYVTLLGMFLFRNMHDSSDVSETKYHIRNTVLLY